jgi:hypothetical protein
MASPGHRENIITHFHKLGIAHQCGNTVEVFTEK